MLSSYMISLVGGDFGIAFNTKIGAEGAGLGIAVDAQLGADILFDAVVDPKSRAPISTLLGSIFDPSIFLPILLDLGFFG